MRRGIVSPGLVAVLAMLVCAACEKGYRVRVSNFYYERLDSVIIGNRAVIFTGIDTLATTEYTNISSGKHRVECLTSGGERFSGLAPLRKGGSGDHTIQIDGLKQITVVEGQVQ